MRFDRCALLFAAILTAAGAAAAGLMDGGASAYRHGGPAQTLAPADQEDAGSQYKIGLMYERGRDVPQDYGEARRRFLKAAASGDGLAEFSLGVLSARGLGAPKDYVEAERWFRKAAERGLAAAQFNLGVLVRPWPWRIAGLRSRASVVQPGGRAGGRGRESGARRGRRQDGAVRNRRGRKARQRLEAVDLGAAPLADLLPAGGPHAFADTETILPVTPC